MSETPNKLYLSASNGAEMRQLISNVYSEYLMNRESKPEVIVIASDQTTKTRRSTKPRIVLYFLQKASDANQDYGQIHAQVSFRLMSEPKDILPERAMYYAQQIKAKFAEPLFSFQKGKELVTYTDIDLGYTMQVYSLNRAEGEKVIEQTLDVQGHSPEWINSNHITNKAPGSKYPDIAPRRTVMGESIREFRDRPFGTVWFRYAFLEIPKIKKIWTLVDTTGVLRNALLQTAPLFSPYSVSERKYPTDTTRIFELS